MSAAMMALLASGEQAHFVTGAVVAASSVVSFSGMNAGDLCAVFVQGVLAAASTPAGWTALILPDQTSGIVQRVIFKTLDAGDIATGFVSVPGPAQAGTVSADYLGAGSAVLRSSTESAAGASTLTLPALVPADNSVGLLIFVTDFNGSGAHLPPALGGLARREGPTSVTGPMYLSAYDITAPGDYPVGAITFTNFDTSAPQCGYVVELLPS